ncbi:polymerase/histidinol phosphatase-like protein [Pseudocohnilembus persalinus]|uniref:Polymerase/histidinol phosphatase-like protein n=1 Tax=Pseudocohnilembus persalinus TaxID=266149 RepID=A0A0V0QP91_PSEPJ|nr:polymerase/histidinol phosphatase-like protein [Pseudocohnilembus persalinus]|eukprot:KRX03996.1 polymerase/histidinol phosphatase-like protein [Pseudocohnilembus persalinus]
MKRGHVQEAIKRGLYFEMQYSPLFYQSDKKRIILQNMMKIVKATKGKNLVITSESQNFLQHRSPQDLVSLKNFKGVISLVSEKDKEYFKIKEQENQIRINNKIQKKLKMQQNDQSQHSKDELLKKFKNRQEIIKKETQQYQKQNKNQNNQNEKKRKQNQVEAEKLEKKQKKQKENEDNNTQTNVKEEIVQKQLIEINSGIDFCIDVNPEN